MMKNPENMMFTGFFICPDILFYPDILCKDSYEILQNTMFSDAISFLLPSSLHEVLLVPDRGDTDSQTLENMVLQCEKT